MEGADNPEEVIVAPGMHHSVIYKWIALYREGGIEALKERRAAAHLSHRRCHEIHLQLGLESALWRRAMVRDVIRQEFDVRLSDVSVGRLLRRLGLSPQR